MDENRLLDGACICDALVEASPEKIVAKFGRPVKLAEKGKQLADEELAGEIVFFAAAWPGSSWSVVEAVGDVSDEEPLDYIVTLLRQARAVLAGKVLQLPLSYENGVGVAHRAAKETGTRAVVVWGSDEWSGLGGGVQLDASGKVVRACNVSGPDEIDAHIASRERMMAGDDEDEGDEESGDEDTLVFYEAGKPLRTAAGEVISVLDGWFKELGAVQPQAPPSLWGVWESYSEVWGARR